MNLSQLTLEIHVAIFSGILLITFLAGLLVGRKQVNKQQKRVLEVENEMLLAHKEILNYAEMNKQLKETLEKAKIPVPFTRIDADETGDEKVRKIQLGKIG